MTEHGVSSILVTQQTHGVAPVSFAWLAYGSQARQDQTLGSDQDNGLLLERELNDSEACYFKALSEYVCEGLNKCGIKTCLGNIMASNPALRMSVEQAISQAKQWVSSPTPEAILKFNIFLDVRFVAGEQALFDKMKRARIPLFKQSQFLAALARNVNETTVPLSLFNRFVLSSFKDCTKCIDIKTQAVSILNSIVRIYALHAGISEPGSLNRLDKLKDLALFIQSNAMNLKEVWLFLNRLRWQHQVLNGVTDNHVRIDSLSLLEKQHLKQAFKVIERAQQVAVNTFSGGLAG